MNSNLPAAAFAHFILKVNDVDASYQFYTKLGLRSCGIFPDLAIIELRGGTHILLFGKNEVLPLSLTSSQLGQRGGFFHERLDLMIEDQLFGHDYFQLTDPDSNGITVYTSHVGELPV